MTKFTYGAYVTRILHKGTHRESMEVKEIGIRGPVDLDLDSEALFDAFKEKCKRQLGWKDFRVTEVWRY